MEVIKIWVVLEQHIAFGRGLRPKVKILTNFENNIIGMRIRSLE
jgi:hypothetical protein